MTDSPPPMRIKQLELRHFKRFDELALPLRPLNCLVGPNNSGKTTLLQSLALFYFCKQHCLSQRNGQIELKNRSIPAEELYTLPVTSPLDLWTDRQARSSGAERAISIRLRFQGGQVATASVKLAYNKLGISVGLRDESQAALTALRDFSIAYLPVFSSFLPQEERRTRIAVEDELQRGRVNLVVRNMLVDLKDQGRHQELVALLRPLFPELEALDITFDEASDRYITVSYKERGRPKSFDLFSAGSGFQQLLYLFGFITLRLPDVILLDEPDVHLHGTLQRSLLGQLRALAGAGRQVLLATHSRVLIEHADPPEVVYLDGDGARPVSIALDVFDVLDELGSLEAAALPALQRYRRLLVIENRSDHRLLAAFGRRLLGLGRWSLVERRLAVCYAEGNPCAQNIDQLRSQIAAALEIGRGETLRGFVIADRDHHPAREELMDRLASEYVEYHVWDRNEIENYLLVPLAIARIVRGKGEGTELLDLELVAQIENRMRASMLDGRSEVQDQLASAFQRYLGGGTDAGTCSRRAREYLELNWDEQQLGLVDAKERVLPELKRWCQAEWGCSFSNRQLAEAIEPDELPEEVASVVEQLARFVGLADD